MRPSSRWIDFWRVLGDEDQQAAALVAGHLRDDVQSTGLLQRRPVGGRVIVLAGQLLAQLLDDAHHRGVRVALDLQLLAQLRHELLGVPHRRRGGVQHLDEAPHRAVRRERRDSHAHRPLAAVAGHARVFALVVMALRGDAQMLGRGLAVFVEDAAVAADHFLVRVAEQLLRPDVPAEDRAAGVAADHGRIGEAVEDGLAHAVRGVAALEARVGLLDDVDDRVVLPAPAADERRREDQLAEVPVLVGDTFLDPVALPRPLGHPADVAPARAAGRRRA